MLVAGRLHRRVEADRIGVVLRAPRGQHRRQIGAAAEPGFRRDDEAGVHMHGRHMRIARMDDQRNAGGPEARIGLGARDLGAEFRREFAMDGGDMHAGLLEQPPMQHRHDAAAAIAAIVAGALPGRALEAAGLAHRPAARRRPRPQAAQARRKYRCAAPRTRRAPWPFRVPAPARGLRQPADVVVWVCAVMPAPSCCTGCGEADRNAPSASAPPLAPWQGRPQHSASAIRRSSALVRRASALHAPPAERPRFPGPRGERRQADSGTPHRASRRRWSAATAARPARAGGSRIRRRS